MLTFLVFLGQVPGTHFFLTFTELFSAYSLCLITYVLQREYRIRKAWLIYIRLVYVMYSHRIRPGRPRKREVLPARIDSAPAVSIDFRHLPKPLWQAHSDA